MNYFDTLLADYGDRQALERKQNRQKFYDAMKELGFDFTDVTDEIAGYDRLPKTLIPVLQNDSDEFHRFNAALAKLNKDKICSVADAIIFIHSDYLDEKQTMKLLDELNFYAAKTEFQKRFRLQVEKKPENDLLDFLDADV